MSAIKKPGLGAPLNSAGWAQAVTRMLSIMAGRGGRKVGTVGITAANAAGATPTAAEFAKVVADLNTIKARFNELLEQVQD